jgi:hypothetical protein
MIKVFPFLVFEEKSDENFEKVLYRTGVTSTPWPKVEESQNGRVDGKISLTC